MKRYRLAWANEVAKVIAGGLCMWIVIGLWLSPESSNDRVLGIVIGLVGIAAMLLLIDVSFRVRAIYKEKHKLLTLKATNKTGSEDK